MKCSYRAKSTFSRDTRAAAIVFIQTQDDSLWHAVAVGSCVPVYKVKSFRCSPAPEKKKNREQPLFRNCPRCERFETYNVMMLAPLSFTSRTHGQRNPTSLWSWQWKSITSVWSLVSLLRQEPSCSELTGFHPGDLLFCQSPHNCHAGQVRVFFLIWREKKKDLLSLLYKKCTAPSPHQWKASWPRLQKKMQFNVFAMLRMWLHAPLHRPAVMASV